MTISMRDIHSTLTLTTAPTLEPVTAEEARVHCRIDDPTEDAYVSTLISAARRYCEQVTDRAIAAQTWKLYLDSFPTEIELRRPPVTAVTGITYVDSAGATQPLATSVYAVDTAHEPGLVTLKYNQYWPSLRGDRNGIVVTFTAGYSTVPDSFKHAIKLLVGHWYRNREATATEVPQDIKLAVESLLWSERWGAYS